MITHRPPHSPVALDLVVRHHPDLLFVLDSEGTILEYLGGPDSELYAPPDVFLGRSLHEVLPAPASSRLAEALTRVRATSGTVVVEYTLPMSGDDRAYEARLVPFGGDGVLAICRDVTESFRTQQRLRASERTLAEAERVGGIGTWLWEAAANRFSWSAGIYRILGLAGADFDGTFEAFLARVHPEDADRTREVGLQALRDRQPTEYECRIIRPDGELRSIAGSISVDVDANGAVTALFGTAVDVTERRRADAALRESEQRFRQIAEAINQVVWLTDIESGNVLYVNPVFESIWGRPVAELYANPALCYGAIAESEQARVVARHEAWLRTDPKVPLTLTYPIVRPDGGVRWVLETRTPIRREDGTLYRLGGVVTDITSQREAAAVRRRLEDQLAHARNMDALGTLAAGIAHNFNNALAVIIGNVDLARMAGLDNRTLLEECLEMIVGASARAQALVSQILTFGRERATELRPESLGPLVEGAAETVRATLPPHVLLTVRIEPDVPSVLADADLVRQTVVNLAANAVQAMREDDSSREGRIDVVVERFEATAEFVQADMVVGSYVKLSVSDNGPGMDETTRRRLFEPFFTTRGPVNAGLGLSVVHGVMARHGGAIRIWSEPGRGSRFDLYFPARDLPGRDVVLEKHRG